MTQEGDTHRGNFQIPQWGAKPTPVLLACALTSRPREVVGKGPRGPEPCKENLLLNAVSFVTVKTSLWETRQR